MMKTDYLKTMLLLFLFHLSAKVHAQTDSIEIRFENSTRSIEEIIQTVQNQTHYSFIYKTVDIELKREVKLPTAKIELNQLLKKAFPENRFAIEVENHSIIIKKKITDSSQTEKISNYSISGYITSQKTGEAIIGATVVVPKTYKGTATNAYGFYSFTLNNSETQIQVSSIGFKTKNITIPNADDQTLDIKLEEESIAINEIEVKAEDNTQALRSVNMNTKRLSTLDIKEVPTLAGEADLMKTIQLLPGVSTKGEGATNFNVRGGSAGQNLILLDEATVYNPSHLMGFFSVFNPDAINSLTFYRNDFPANYGSRLSSVLDIQMKEGNMERFSVSGGIGTVSSRLMLEGPLVKNKSSFLITGRRTYADLSFRLSADEYTRKSKLYFYDYNLKTNYKFNDKNRIFLSGYFGKDAIKITPLNYHIFWGNATGTLRWNHIFNSRLFLNSTLIYSNYNYEIDFPRATNPVNWEAGVSDLKAKVDFTWYPNALNTIKFGTESSFKDINPGRPIDENSVFQEVPQAKTNLNSIYVSNEQKVGQKLTMSYGVRLNQYNLLSPYEELSFNGNVSTSKQYNSGIVTNKFGLEPRLGLSYLTGRNSSLKFNYTRTLQYLHLLSNSATSFSVLDVWYPTNNNIAPASSDNFSMGWFLKFAQNKYRFTSEVYYRKLNNQLDFADHSLLIMNRNVEKLLKPGKGEAYGLEVSLEKNTGKLTGAVSYSYSRVFYKIPEINDGDRYPAAHDQPHRINVSGAWQLSKRSSFSANWVYSSGYATTLPVETFVYNDYIVPVYGKKNSDRIPDYHRLDFAFTLKNKEKPNRNREGSWVFSLYNAYGRLNPLTVFVGPKMQDVNVVEDPNKIAYQKFSLFSVFPSVTYNFKF
ncbi:TonB-dependent receptor [Maribellus maritimus]|uniref:TonB-dependent receptor n=1 Tax=Maribellus maritimus TaxID=2870838 RepID=UPI001EEAFE15|nr:TonB-dependent receptor [Maribellus maritimus]MCG6190039.1 TonB-dependent receptor [Maribellus maritimus]